MSKSALSERNALLQDAASKNLLVTQEELASLMQVSTGTIGNYTRQGMPCLYIGTAKGGKGSIPRYKYQDCISWLEKRN